MLVENGDFAGGVITVSDSVIDIGGSKVSDYIKPMLEKRLLENNPSSGRNRLLPTPLLSDDVGLSLWHKINRLPNYYQTRDEVELLEYHGEEIARHIPDGCTLIDLGSGDTRKVKPILEQLESMQKNVRYYAVDLSRQSLEEGTRIINYRASRYKYVECFALWGTFEDAFVWSSQVTGPIWSLSLGSIFGNDFFEPAVARLSKWAKAMRPQDRMLLGMDATSDRTEIWNSYHDSYGLFDAFMRNGLENSNKVLGHTWYRDVDWFITGAMQEDPVMHRFVFRAIRDVDCELLNLHFAKGDEIDCYEGFKYDPSYMKKQFVQAGLHEIAIWPSPSGRIYEYLLSAHDFNDAVSVAVNV